MFLLPCIGAIMPIFEYRCESCGIKFEVILLGDQKPECPKCHARSLEQQFSTFAVGATSHKTAAPVQACGESNCCRMNGGCSAN
jgi:putative FmdB family regulatory protein